MIIERATAKSVSEYLEEKLWSQIMEYDALFSIDSRKSGFEYMPSRLIARAIDYARFGQLFLHEGKMKGEQLISKEWVRDARGLTTNINGGDIPTVIPPTRFLLQEILDRKSISCRIKTL